MASEAQKAAPAPPRAVNAGVLVAGLIVAVPLFVVLLVNIKRDPHAIASPIVGRSAPGFTLAPVGGGKAVSLASLRGKPVVINFWASYCVPCVEEHGLLTGASRRLAADVQFLGMVYQDDEALIQGFLAQHGSAYPTLLDPDSKVAIAYGVYGVPETYFVDREGRIAAKFVGPLTRETLGENLKKAGF